MKTSVFFILAALLFSACQENAVSEQAVPTLPTGAQDVTIMRQADDDLSLQERAELVSELDASTIELFSQMGPSWTDAHQTSENFLQSLDPVARPYAEQMVSTHVLRMYLLPGEPTQEKAEAALMHVTALVDARNQQADLIHTAIETYADLWPKEQTVALADKAATAGTEYLAQQAESCETCEGDLAKLVQQDLRMAMIDRAVTDLQKIDRN